MPAKHLAFIALALLTLSRPAAAEDRLVDGVPLPSDAAPATASPGTALQRQWSGVWVGAWGGVLKHILLVESVAEDGAARVVYAVGERRGSGAQPIWLRLEGIATERSLKVQGTRFSATYELTGSGGLKARYESAGSVSRASMTRADFASLTKPDAVVAWTRAKFEFLETGLIEDGRPVRLEAVIFKPDGAGPFPLAVINHGSTGGGRDPAVAKQTWFAADLADFLNARGWMVAFPQRRGRGKSDGLYDEGFSENRKLGYACDTERSLRGADRALSDIDAAIAALRRRPERHTCARAHRRTVAWRGAGGCLCRPASGANIRGHQFCRRLAWRSLFERERRQPGAVRTRRALRTADHLAVRPGRHVLLDCP